MEVDRVQPRPSRRDRSRDPEGPLGDSAPTDHRHPRPDRPPAAVSTCTYPPSGPGHRRGTCCGTTRPDRQPPSPSDYPAGTGATRGPHGKRQKRLPTAARNPVKIKSRVRRSEDPHWWIRAQGTVSSGISGSTPRDAIARIQPVRDSDRTAPLADYCPLPATPPAATKPSVRTGSGTRSSQISRQ